VGSCRTALEPGETLSLHLLFGRVYDFWQIKAADLGFSCCIGDAYSLLRDGIEFTAHAHKIFNEPVVTKAWAEKMQGKTQTGAYDKNFTHNKKKNLFPDKFGLKQLHMYYAKLSEIGTHSNTPSLGKSFKDASTPTTVSWGFHYFETDPRKIAVFLFSMLVISTDIEETFFGCYKTRLNLDYELVEMRNKFNQIKERKRVFLKAKYKIGVIKQRRSASAVTLLLMFPLSGAQALNLTLGDAPPAYQGR